MEQALSLDEVDLVYICVSSHLAYDFYLQLTSHLDVLHSPRATSNICYVTTLQKYHLALLPNTVHEPANPTSLGREHVAMAYDSEIPLQLLGQEMTLGDALEEEENMLRELEYPQNRIDFCAHLLNHCDTLIAIVAHHLNVDPEVCSIADFEHWRHGSFNWCIPVTINSAEHSPVLLRFPLLYKVGESEHPGNADEKLRCEAATYIHLRQNCPDIPVPKLWGFGFSNGSAVGSRVSLRPDRSTKHVI